MKPFCDEWFRWAFLLGGSRPQWATDSKFTPLIYSIIRFDTKRDQSVNNIDTSKILLKPPVFKRTHSTISVRVLHRYGSLTDARELGVGNNAAAQMLWQMCGLG
jgi:hypothetical protein